MNWRIHFVWTALLAVSLGCGSEAKVVHTVNKPVPTHPVFNTVLTGQAQSRPAIQVNLLDESEDWFMTAELYLTVQSSRFPQDTRIVLPLNIGDFAGCRTRFVQLPFEVQERDMLLFNLLDNDRLTSEQETAIVEGCRACGYCLLAAGKIYCPPAATIASPVVGVASELLGNAIVEDVALHQFENFGTAEYIVPQYLPPEPQQANELSILNDANYAPATLKLYGPLNSLSFEESNRDST